MHGITGQSNFDGLAAGLDISIYNYNRYNNRNNRAQTH